MKLTDFNKDTLEDFGKVLEHYDLKDFKLIVSTGGIVTGIEARYSLKPPQFYDILSDLFGGKIEQKGENNSGS